MLMLGLIARRVLGGLLTLLIVSVIVFAGNIADLVGTAPPEV